jgi:endoglycosylceramidase
MKLFDLAALLLILCSVVNAHIKVDTQNSLLKDEFGRYRFYHGVNTVYKVFPFYPITDHFDSNNSLC